MCEDGTVGRPPSLKLRRGSLRATWLAKLKLRSSEGWCRRRDLNPRPPAYEADALPLSYVGISRAYDPEKGEPVFGMNHTQIRKSGVLLSALAFLGKRTIDTGLSRKSAAKG